MNYRTYFAFCLFMPVMGGVLAHVVPLSESFEFNYFSFGSFIFIARYSLFVGGIPYAFSAVAAFVWSNFRSYEQVRRRAWLLPLLFLPVLGVYIALEFTWNDPEMFLPFFSLAAIYGIFLGYFYVGLAYLGWWGLEKYRERRAEPVEQH